MAIRERVVGIDLGTTNSLIACMEGARPRVIAGSDGDRLVPSVVSLMDNGEIVVGNTARKRLIDAPGRTAYSIKRLMGKAAADIAADLPLLPFSIREESDAVIRVGLGDRTFTPPEISAYILRQLRQTAEDELAQPVGKAVITVPAYFDDAQRQATRDAGRIAGLDVLRLVNEPTAAALAYGLHHRRDGIVAVYDLGGGTFDISILKLHDGIFEVLATNGDTHLGGDDIDDLLVRIGMEDIRTEWKEDISGNGEAVQLLRRAVVQAKERLSYFPETRFALRHGGRTYQRRLTRDMLEQLIAGIVERTLERCRQCIRDAGVPAERVGDVVLVGGSTRIPMVRRAVAQLFGKQPHADLNPDEVVALGAAVQGGILAGSVEGKLLLDVTPLSLGIETLGGVVSTILPRNSTIPASASETFTTAVDGQTNVLIHVVQGERDLVVDCRSLARFDLKGVEPMPAGMARVEVRFLIDANGILNVTARDARTGKQQAVEVKPTYGLTEGEVSAMLADAVQFAGRDADARVLREARLAADAILEAVDKAKGDEAWRGLDAHERQQIVTAVNELLLVYHYDDHELIGAKIAQLDAATAGLARAMMNRGGSRVL